MLRSTDIISGEDLNTIKKIITDIKPDIEDANYADAVSVINMINDALSEVPTFMDRCPQTVEAMNYLHNKIIFLTEKKALMVAEVNKDADKIDEIKNKILQLINK